MTLLSDDRQVTVNAFGRTIRVTYCARIMQATSWVHKCAIDDSRMLLHIGRLDHELHPDSQSSIPNDRWTEWTAVLMTVLTADVSHTIIDFD